MPLAFAIWLRLWNIWSLRVICYWLPRFRSPRPVLTVGWEVEIVLAVSFNAQSGAHMLNDVGVDPIDFILAYNDAMSGPSQ